MQRALLKYGVAVTAVVLALLISLLIPPLQDRSPTALLFAAVMMASWYGGLGPGLVATGVSALAIEYFSMPPTGGIIVDLGDLLRIAVFVMEASLISWLNGRRKQLAESLRQQNDQLIAAHRHKDEFLGALAHELRSPLAAIHNGLQVLHQSRASDVQTRQVCELGERQIRHLSRLVDDLLDVTRISQGKVRLNKEAVDIASLTGEAVAVCRPFIDARRHELTIALPPEPVRLEADPIRLQQVMVNILLNAAKYTDPGGRIWLSAALEGQELIIRVRDTGVGIAPELLPTIFDRYTQSLLSLDRSQGGLGIGLSLVRGLVELHGGAVEAHSAGDGQGSEFVVRLPCTGSAGKLGTDSGSDEGRDDQGSNQP